MAQPSRKAVVTTAAKIMLAVSGQTGVVIVNSFVTVLVQIIQSMSEGNKGRADDIFKTFIKMTEAHMKETIK